MAETFNNANVRLTTTSATDVYQAPTANAADRAIVLSCMVANTNTTNNQDVTITITDSANTLLSVLAGPVTVPAKSALEVISNKVVLKQSQKVRATATSANDLQVTLSSLEMTV